MKLAWNRNKIDQLHAKSVFGLARWLARCNQLASHWCTRLPLNPGECNRFSLVANNSHRISKRTRLVPRRIVTYRTPFSPPDLRADSLFAAGLTCGLTVSPRTYVPAPLCPYPRTPPTASCARAYGDTGPDSHVCLHVASLVQSYLSQAFTYVPLTRASTVERHPLVDCSSLRRYAYRPPRRRARSGLTSSPLDRLWFV